MLYLVSHKTQKNQCAAEITMPLEDKVNAKQRERRLRPAAI